MEKRKGIIKAQPRPEFLPETDILQFYHRGKISTARWPAFGPGSYVDNIGAMRQQFYHSNKFPDISFRPATTSESISITYDNLADVEEKILDPRWLQLGYHVLTSELVFFNPPKDFQGNPIIDKNVLKNLLNDCRKAYGIYLGNNDFSAAPYESFRQGFQESREFAESGLARALEHTDEKKAPLLEEISSKKHYSRDVKIFGYDAVKKPVLRVFALGSDRSLDGRLYIVGDYVGGYMSGSAFGVSQTGEAIKQ